MQMTPEQMFQMFQQMMSGAQSNGAGIPVQVPAAVAGPVKKKGKRNIVAEERIANQGRVIINTIPGIGWFFAKTVASPSWDVAHVMYPDTGVQYADGITVGMPVSKKTGESKVVVLAGESQEWTREGYVIRTLVPAAK